MGTLGEVIVITSFGEPAVKTDETELIAACPIPTVRRYLGFEHLDRRHDVVE